MNPLATIAALATITALIWWYGNWRCIPRRR
jgi:hypothetical protein